MAPYIQDFPYKDLKKLIKKGGEGRVYLVERKSDKKIFAAKMRFNPAIRVDLQDDYDGIIDVYKNFLTEVDMLSHSNHKNVSSMI